MSIASAGSSWLGRGWSERFTGNPWPSAVTISVDPCVGFMFAGASEVKVRLACGALGEAAAPPCVSSSPSACKGSRELGDMAVAGGWDAVVVAGAAAVVVAEAGTAAVVSAPVAVVAARP